MADAATVGRPLKFANAVELQKAIDKYFKSRDAHWEVKSDWVVKLNDKGKPVRDENGQPVYVKAKVRRFVEKQPYLMTGLARALNVDRKTIKNYSEREEFFHTVAEARSRCEESAEDQLFTPYATGARFNLNVNYDWVDKQQQEMLGEQKVIVETRHYDADPDH